MNNLYVTCLTILSFCLFSACGNHLNTTNTNNQLQPNEVNTKKLSIVEKLKENSHLPVKERIALYHKLKANHFDSYDFGNETELTLYGYSFLNENNLIDALAIFELITVEFPNSANSFDSLGEAYLLAKDSTKAIQNYEKSLLMNPENFHAEDVIQSIKYPSVKPLTTQEKFSKIYSKEYYIADLDQLGQKLLAIHPYPFKFISKEQFWKNIETKKSLITEHTTYAEFAWHCNAIIASLGCSHTTSSTMQNAYHEFGIVPLEKTFPLQVRLIDGKLFVVNPMNNTNKIKIKDEISSINGIETPKLISDIFQHISAQANSETFRRQKFNTSFALMIPYTLGLPKTFEVQLKGSNESIMLKKPVNFASEWYDQAAINCPNNLCFDIVDKNTAILTISTFNYYDWNNEHLVFNAFIDKSIQELHNKKIKNLIIDVRYNGGGSQYPSIYLLQHLVDKAFIYYSKSEFEGKTETFYGEGVFQPNLNRFKGKVYFLIDGNGTSTTGHFMSLVKSLNLGTIIGEELGSNQFCTAGQTLCRLKHTKLVVSIANNVHISSATNLPDDIGIRPDFYVTQNIDEYLNSVDAIKEFTLKLIRK
jgi:C-terminal processing protease CtpA/Prc